MISKAASSVTVTGGSFTYDGSAHAASAVASTTVGALSNPNAVVISYSGSCTAAPTTVAEGSSCTATGTYPGDENHSGSSNSATIVINKAGQTITFTSMIVTASATSGQPVSFSSSNPGVCSVTPVPGSNDQALVTLLSGSWSDCSVLANQGGGDNYSPAPQAAAVLKVTP